jgi:hypothetical protein
MGQRTGRFTEMMMCSHISFFLLSLLHDITFLGANTFKHWELYIFAEKFLAHLQKVSQS